MTGMKRRLVVAIAGVLLLSAHVEVQSGDDARRPANRQWPAVSGDWGNTRHSTLNQITTQNITKLGAAWTSQKFDAGRRPRRSQGLSHEVRHACRRANDAARS